MAKKIAVVGGGNIGKATAVSRANKVKPEPIKKQVRKIEPVKREHFKTEEEWNAFLEFTKPIFLRLKKVPDLPCKTLGEYLQEYNLIMKKQSQLTATQRIMVKNVIHVEVRKGTITLTTE